MTGKRMIGTQLEMECVTATFRESHSPFRESAKPFYTETSGNQGSILTLDSLSETPLTERLHVCKYEECLRFHSGAVSAPDPESPESPLKNNFLYLVLIMLITWILVYAILSRIDLL